MGDISKDEATQALKAIVEVLGYLGLIYKMGGHVSPEHPEPFHVPFAGTAERAYEMFTPEVRETIVKSLQIASGEKYL